MSFTLPDAVATERLGAALARTCPWNSALSRAIYLQGELGAGKTTLVRGLLRALGVTGAVRSPSYALFEPYTVAAGTVLHVDLYRVRGAAETEALGLRDEFRGGALVWSSGRSVLAARCPCRMCSSRCGRRAIAGWLTCWGAALREPRGSQRPPCCLKQIFDMRYSS